VINSKKNSPDSKINTCQKITYLFSLLFKFSVLYPHDHENSIKITHEFLSNVRLFLRGFRTLIITIDKKSLYLNSLAVDPEWRGCEKPHGILSHLGITRVEIDTDSTGKNLHDFVSLLIQYKNQTDSVLRSNLLDYSGLPLSIRVVQQEFGKRIRAEKNQDPGTTEVQKAVNTIMDSFDHAGFSEQDSSPIEHKIGHMFGKVAEKLETTTQTEATTPEEYNRTLSDVLNLGVEIIQQAVRDLLLHDPNSFNLKKLFETAESAIALSGDSESAQVMLDILKQVADEDEAEPATVATPSKEFQASIRQLYKALELIETSSPPLTDIKESDQCEYISVVMQQHIRSDVTNRQTILETGLHQIFSRQLNYHELNIIIQTSREIINTQNMQEFDRYFSKVVEISRKHHPFHTSRLFLQLFDTIDDRLISYFWPHLTNDILRGLKIKTLESMSMLYVIASSLSWKAMRRELLRLEKLDTLQIKQFSSHLFQPPVRDLYPVFAVLMTSSCEETVYSLIIDGFLSDESKNMPIPELFTFREYDPDIKKFIILFLRQGYQKDMSEKLNIIAVKIISKILKTLPPKRRLHQGTPSLILALGKLKHVSALPLLKKIRTDRKLLISYIWPVKCRKAASRAEKKIVQLQKETK